MYPTITVGASVLTPLEGAGLAVGAFALVAPTYWPNMPRNFNRALVTGGVMLLAYSALGALQESLEMHVSIGPKWLYLLAALLLAIAIIWQLEINSTTKHDKLGTAAENPKPAPVPTPAPFVEVPLGTLRIRNPIMNLTYKESTGQWAAEMTFDIVNTSDRTLNANVVLEGTINGASPAPTRTTLSVMIFGAETKRFTYGRMAPITFVDAKNIQTPALVGQLNYAIDYKSHEATQFSRKTGKTLTFNIWGKPDNQKPGSMAEFKTNVLYTNEIEQ